MSRFIKIKLRSYPRRIHRMKKKRFLRKVKELCELGKRATAISESIKWYMYLDMSQFDAETQEFIKTSAASIDDIMTFMKLNNKPLGTLDLTTN